jgi:hypothetical protein
MSYYQYLGSVHVSRYLFWAEVSNWNFNLPTSDIFRADLAGSRRKHMGNFRSMYVSGLALDMVRRRLYISDQHKQTIECTNYEGNDKYTVAVAEVISAKY